MALRPVVLDTDIISAIMREDPVVLSKALAYLMEHGRFTLSIIFSAGFNINRLVLLFERYSYMNADTTRPQEQGNTEDLQANKTHLPRFSGPWQPKMMGQIGLIYGGLSGKSKSDFGRGTARYVTFLNVLEHVIIDLDLLENVFVSPSEAQNRVLSGDLLFNGTSETPGDLAMGAVVQADIPDLYLNSFCFGFRIYDPSSYDAQFLAYFFRGPIGRQIMYALAQGATRYNMSKQKFLELEINIPRYAEQRAIAEVLSDVDGLIQSLDALIAKKRAIKQATMQQLLTGKTRLPGFSGAWRPKMMRQIGLTYGGLTGKSKSDFGRGTAHYVTFLNVLEHVIVDIDLLENVFVNPSETQNRVLSGDLLFNGTSETPGDLAMGAVVQADIPDLYLNSFCFGFRIYDPSSYDAQFLAYFFRGPIGRQIMYALAQGATRYNMSKQKFLELEINLPSVEEQTAIATILSDMDAEIAALERRRDKTCAIKQGMMQQLLTGRIRLVKSE